MARATYTCAKCGTSISVSGRNSREADSIARSRQQRGDLCRSCWDAERDAQKAAENAAAADLAQRCGWPELTGSEKAVAWAGAIRARILPHLPAIAEIAELIGTPHERAAMSDDRREEVKARLTEIAAAGPGGATLYHAAHDALASGLSPAEIGAALEIISERTSASWWIDQQHLLTVSYQLRNLIETLRAEVAERLKLRALAELPPDLAELAEAARAESILTPAGGDPELICEIAMSGDTLTATLPVKHEGFRELMHQMRMRWSAPRWARVLGVPAGDPAHRMAELAHRILALGIAVQLTHETARGLALSGTFEPEHPRWITQLKRADGTTCFVATWAREDDLYETARSIPGARWKDRMLQIPPTSAEAVVEFADSHDFRISPGAWAMIEEHRTALAGGAVVVPRVDRPVRIRAEVLATPQPMGAPEAAEIDPDLIDG